jgi:hypothetical protein
VIGAFRQVKRIFDFVCNQSPKSGLWLILMLGREIEHKFLVLLDGTSTEKTMEVFSDE